MWRYAQRGGDLRFPDGGLFCRGYAGWDDGDGIPEPGEGKNDPSMQGVRNVGPLPVGVYLISEPFDHPTIGSFVLRLTPAPGTDTLGRSGFLIHGDNQAKPGAGSHGCIVIGRAEREFIAASGDRLLRVVAE